jgi:hypothetical protein
VLRNAAASMVIAGKCLVIDKVEFVARRIYRVLEVQLVESDQLIDAATANRLREDADCYIRSNTELMPLPRAV